MVTFAILAALEKYVDCGIRTRGVPEKVVEVRCSKKKEHSKARASNSTSSFWGFSDLLFKVFLFFFSIFFFYQNLVALVSPSTSIDTSALFIMLLLSQVFLLRSNLTTLGSGSCVGSECHTWVKFSSHSVAVTFRTFSD